MKEALIRHRYLIVVALLMALFVAPSAYAQSTAVAHLSGVVTDDSGAVLPGVEVTVTQTNTGMTRFVITGARGEYAFSNLPIGPYRLSAKLEGFRAFEQSGITLNIGDTRAANVIMGLGALTETVRVTADANLVETRSLTIGSVTHEEQLVGLPLDGRSATQLILLSGGAVVVGGTDDRQPAGAVAIAVNGGSGTSTLYLVDGGYNNDPQQNSGNAIPFPDALQEFRVETGVRDARYGMSTAATVNAVTKSGTNVFHGGAFEFARHYQFNSQAFFERVENGGLGRNDGLKRNQFGGTFGGPILRDRLFFFGGVQITDQYNVPLNTGFTVPTAEVLRGDFRRIMSATCRGRTSNLQLGWPFVDNQIDPALFHPISMKVVSMVPVADPANDPDGCGRYLYARPNNQLDRQFVARVDYQLAPNKRVFARNFIATNDHPALWDPNKPNLLDQGGDGRGLNGRQNTISTGFDWVMSPRLFSTTRFSYQHTMSNRQHGECTPTWSILGVKTWTYTAQVDPNGNYTCGKLRTQDFLNGGLWDGANGGIFLVDTPSFSQDFDWTVGSHSVSFGGSLTRPHANGDGTFAANGNMNFSGIYTSGTAQATGGFNMADFMLGYVSAYNGAGSQINNAWVQSPGVYINDIWRLNRRLTVNVGVRWDPYIAVKDANGFNMRFDRANYEAGIRSTVYKNAPIGLVFNGDPGFPTNGGNTNNYLPQIAPRFGAVWDPTGDSKQTIRAGGGLYYESPKLWTTAHVPLNPPFGNDVDATHPAACAQTPFVQVAAKGCPLIFEDPWRFTPGGDPQAALSHQGEPVVLPRRDVVFPTNGAYKSQPVGVNPERTWQYNVSYQRQLPGRVLAEITYLGSRTVNTNLGGYSENPVLYIPGNCQAGQYGLTAPGPCSNNTQANLQARGILSILNPAEGKYFGVNGGTGQMYPLGRGHYNSVKFSLNKRLSNNWSATSNYTLSKCINQGEPATNIGGTSFPVAQKDPFNDPRPDPKTSEGYCGSDRRHMFNLTTIAISPGLSDGIVRMVTKDWQVGFILQARSGSPFTPGVNGDPTFTGWPLRAVVVPGVDPYVAEDQRDWVLNSNGFRNRMPWINPAAFAAPGPGEWGNAKRNSLRGPGFFNADLAFSRNVNVRAGKRIEIRVEAFNVFNTVNWSTPSFSVGSTNNTNGMISNTTGSARIMQFALKYNF